MPSSAAARRFARGSRAGAPRLRRFAGGLGGRLHLAATLFLAVGLFAPIVTLTSLTAAAAPVPRQPAITGSLQGPPNAPPPFPAPTQVSIDGSFGSVPLNEHRGVFFGAAPFSPGDYDFRVTTFSSDGQRSLGEDADPNGDDLEFDVPNDAIGVYFSYHYRTGEIVAEPFEVQVTIQGDFGSFDARPVGGNNYEVFFSSQAGVYNFQVLVNGQPAGNPGQINLDNNGRVHLVVDDQGNVQTQETVPQAGLTVTKTDLNGVPQTGSCFGLFDGNDLATQACDIDDAEGENGSTFLLFLDGGAGENFDLIETFIPDGQNGIEEIEVPLNDGEFNQIAVQAEGDEGPGPDATEESDEETDVDVTEEPDLDEGDSSVSLVAVDEGQTIALPDACFQPEGGEEVCDDDDGNSDGVTTLTGLPEGAQILVTETEAPDGYANAGAFPIFVVDGSQLGIPHQLGAEEPDEEPTEEATEEATEEPTEQPDTDDGLGSVLVESRDQETGDLIPGACYSGENEIGPYGPKCDDDGDGVVDFTNLGPGDQAIRFAEPAPSGFELVGDDEQDVDVDGGDTETVVFEFQAQDEADVQPEGPGTLTVLFRDESDAPVGGVTIEISVGGASLGTFTDDGSGQLGFGEVGAGEYTVEVVDVPSGVELTGDDSQDVTVDPGEDETVTFTFSAEDDGPGPGEGTGNLTILIEDENGNPVENSDACFTVENAQGVFPQDGTAFCDTDGDGQIGLTAVVSGPNTVREAPQDGGVGAAEETEQTVEVDPGEDETVTFVFGAEAAPDDGPGALTILIRDTDDQLIPTTGAQYSITNEDGESETATDENNDGQVFFDTIPAGTYEIESLSSPDGYVLVGDETQTVEVVTGEDASVTFAYELEEVEPEAGTLRYLRTDDEDNPLGGACILLEGQQSFGPVCDNQQDGPVVDADPDDGEIEVQNLPEDDYLVSEPTSPEGHPAPDPDFANVDAGETEEYAVSTEPLAAPTADLVLVVDDGQGGVVGGTCFELLDEDGDVAVEEVCDEDGDVPDDGRVGFIGIPIGTYTYHQTRANDAYEAAPDGQIDVPEGGIEVPVTNPPLPPETADLLITRRNQDGDRVGGGCYVVTDTEGATLAEGCDNDPAVDANDDDGRIRFDGVTVPDEGDVTIAETQSPAGLLQAEAQTTALEPDETAQVEFETGPSLGSMTIDAEDADGAPLTLVCYQVDNGAGSFGPFCDDENGAGNGQYVLDQVFPGDNTITVVTTPGGFATPGPQTVPVEAGEETAVVFVFEQALGAVEITKTDENGDQIADEFCFSLQGAQAYGPICDNDANDADPAAGVVLFVDVLAGDYEAVEDQPPAGYEQAPNTPLTVTAGETTPIEVQNVPSGGAVEIVVQAEDGSPLGEACFVLKGEDQDYGPVCDNDGTDADDSLGVVRFANVAPGAYEVVQDSSAQGVVPAESIEGIELEAGAVETVTVTNAPPAPEEPETGAVQIVKTDAADQPLGESCFVLEGQDQDYGPICDDDDNDGDDTVGTILFPEVLPGTYQPIEDTAPPGFDPAEGIEPVVVEAGAVASVTVVDTPPAPETGSVEILKTGQDEQPLEGACFVLEGEDQDYGPVCSDAAGSTLFPEVLPGTYDVIEETTPEGYVTNEQIDPVTVVAGRSALVPVANALEVEETGGLEITKTDAETGEILDGSCFGLAGPTEVAPVCDGSPADGAPDEPGVILIAGIPPGEYTWSETQAPDDYIAATGGLIDVPAGEEPATLTVENSQTPTPVGSVLVRSEDPETNLIPGACYLLTAADGTTVEICDNAPDDPATEVGLVRFDGVVEGEATVDQTTVPTAYLQPDPDSQPTTVVADDTVEVTFVHEPEDSDLTGGLQLELEDSDGDPTTTEEPFFLRRSEGTEEVLLGPFQDNGERDADPAEGTLLLEEIPVGTWSIVQPQEEAAPDGALVARSLPNFTEKSVTVQANVIIIVIIIIIIEDPEDGNVLITKRDEETGLRIPGSCFRIVSLDDPGTEYLLCDDDFQAADLADADLTPGRLRADDLPEGAYEWTEEVVPAGYTADDGSQEFVIQGGETTLIVVFNTPIPDPTGDLVIIKLNEEDEELLDACFELRSPNGMQLIVPQVCDDDDGDSDGHITFTDLAAQQFLLREKVAPEFYALGPDRLVTVIAGDVVEIEYVDVLLYGTVIIEKRAEAEDGDLLMNACFRLDGRNGAPDYAELCDNDDGMTDGKTTFLGILPGEYTGVETVTPTGFDTPDPQDFEIDPDETLTLIFVDEELPPPPETGDVLVYKVDEHGDPLPGACFSLRLGALTVKGPVCDSADGSSDGTIFFDNVQVGTLTLHETKKPSGDYQTAPDREVDVEADETTEITVENELRPGRVLIIKVNPYGHPLQGACYDLSPDGQAAKCSNANGEILYENLVPGTYKATETVAPPGYLLSAAVNGILVKPGATTVITIVDKPKPPDPNTGSIRVIKFYCPAGKGGEFTKIIDNSDPGGGQLAQTAGCTTGDADFTLTRVGGEGGPGAISTGADGTYQATLVAGTYQITETAPDLPGEATEQLAIYKNQQTTIIVINYVKPPAPAPVRIDVIKYTCDQGYAGTLYADFLANCGDPSQLTNGVTFRISGQATGKGITGDGGQKGVTVFGNLPAGGYTVKEETPAYTTVYVFCGLDVNNPTLKAVGAQINFTLQPGQKITCVFFNVPAEVTDNTGAIQIIKYTCPIKTPPAGYDFKANCKPQAFSVQFSLSFYNGETKKYEPKTTGGTNANGLLQFDRLTPGTYQIKEIGADWCFAESNSVNAVGDVIVRANQLAQVWIFNCNPTKGPPNTGTGTAALAAAGGGNAAALAFGLLWPLLGAAGWRLRRRRRAA